MKDLLSAPKREIHELVQENEALKAELEELRLVNKAARSFVGKVLNECLDMANLLERFGVETNLTYTRKLANLYGYRIKEKRR